MKQRERRQEQANFEPAAVDKSIEMMLGRVFNVAQILASAQQRRSEDKNRSENQHSRKLR